MQEMYVSITVLLPDDVCAAATRHAAVATALAEMMEKLGSDDVRCTVSLNESRSRSRPRKPRGLPRLVSTAPEVA